MTYFVYVCKRYARHLLKYIKSLCFIICLIGFMWFHFKYIKDFKLVWTLKDYLKLGWINSHSSLKGCPKKYTITQCELGICVPITGKVLQSQDCKLFGDVDYINLNSSTVDEFVFVTAASENHSQASLYCIDTVQKYFTGTKIIFYDIGITSTHWIQQIEKIQNLEYRKLDFSRYPAHVQTISQYFWKPLVIMEALRDYSAVFWIDSTVRFTAEAQNLSHLFSYILAETKGVLLFQNNPTCHTNYAVTHPSMYDYLLTDIGMQKETKQYGSGTMVFYRTKWVMENIMYWFVLCALDKDCFAPAGSEVDCKKENKHRKYWDCHRYDQAVINILLSNAFSFNTNRYAYPGQLLTINWRDTP